MVLPPCDDRGADDGVQMVRLGPADAGEVLTLQRAAFVGEAQAHDDPWLPPLTQTLAELVGELADERVLALGLRAGSRLVGAVRVRVDGPEAHLGRLAVAPDCQRQGLGSRLLRSAEAGLPPGVREVRLFTGDRSLANHRLYLREGYRETGRSPAGGHHLVHFTKPRPEVA